MGIQYLNSYFKRNTGPMSINKIKFSELKNKIIVIDASIYLYRFLAENALLENIYIMISLFRQHNITPIFVFDGVAPLEKKALLEKRNQIKNKAEEEYNMMKKELESILSTDNAYQDLYESMITLKKKFIRLKRSDVVKVQNLLSAFGIKYIEAPNEADELCAKLVIKKQAYACLTEDMDLFLYGCPRVLRYLSLLNETVIIYYLDKILIDLHMTFNEFKEICVISGTDYNIITDNKTNLYKTLKYFEEFKKVDTDKSFYEWLDETSDYISNIYKLYANCHLFRTEHVNIKRLKLNNMIGTMDTDKIEKIMIPQGFIFIK